MPIALGDILDQRLMALQLRSRRPPNALREMIRLFQQSESLREPDYFLEQVLARERTSSTLGENGVAFPHARTALVDRIALAVGRSGAGIPWNANGERARLIFLVAVPQQLVNDYLVIVGTLARITKDPARRKALLDAKTAPEFVDLLRSAPSL